MRRISCARLVIAGLLALGTLSARGWGEPLEYSATFSGEIEEWREAKFNPHIGTWGQGHTAAGLPNLSQNGAAATFSAGAAGDIWKPTGQARKYCNGAVGNTYLWVWQNTGSTVRLVNAELFLVDSAGRQAPATAWLGHKVDGVMHLETQWNLPRRRWYGCGYSYELYLYCCAQRQGLQDAAGTYTGTITVEILPSCWH